MKKLFFYAVDFLTKPFDRYYLDKDKREHERSLKNAVIQIGASDETKRLREEIFNNPAKKTRLTFINLQNKSQRNVIEMLEDTNYAMPGTPDYINEHDRIFHAKLTIKGYRDGGSTIEVLDQKDIYMYQPRVTCTTNGGTKKVFAGPKFLRNGNMNSKACYCIKDSTGTLLYATLPKREILSNRIFDFDSTLGDNFMSWASEIFGEDSEMLGKFISIEYDKDSNGLMIPVPIEQEASIVENYQKPENRVNIEGVISQLKRQIRREKEIQKELEEQIRKRESMRRVAENQAVQTTEPQQTETERLNEENARIINNKLRYGTLTPGEQGLRGPGRMMPPPMFGGPGGMMPPPPGDGGPILGRRL